MKNSIQLKIKFLVALLIISSANSFAGGPWLQKKKHGFAQAQFIIPAYGYSSMLMGTLIKDLQGVNRKTINADFGIYLEYGITDRLNVITSLPFKYVKTGELTDQLYFENLLPEGELIGLSNYQLALKYGLIDKKVKLAVSLLSSWNTGRSDLDKGLATGYDAASIGLMAHVGRSKEKSYGFLEIGFHKFTNGFSDALEINLEHGWKLGQRWNIAAALNARHPLRNGDYYNENLAQTGLYPNDQGWAAIGLKTSYETDSKWGFNAGIPLIPLRFKYVGFNGTVTLGVYKKF
ncbi:MAG: hypothetical protein ACI8ZM_003520 [Crocinitomix sp.]|jgi:hypothetical protein